MVRAAGAIAGAAFALLQPATAVGHERTEIAAQGASRTPISTRDLVEVAEISGVSLSPDERLVAYRVARASVDANAVVLDWFIVPVGGGVPVSVGSGGAAQHGGSGVLSEQLPLWDRDSKGLRFRALVDGAVGIWHWREGTLRREIVDDADIVGIELSLDGRYLRYWTGAPRAAIDEAQRKEYASGVLVDHRLDIMEPVVGGTVEDGKRVMQRVPGNWFDRKGLLSENPKQEKIVDLNPLSPASNAPVFPQQDAAQALSANRSDGAAATVLSQGGRRELVVTRADGQRIACKAAICGSEKLAAITWRPEREMLLLFERSGSARENIWLWQVGAPKLRLVARSDGPLRSGSRPPRCSIGSSAIVCLEASAVSPPRLVAFDYRSEKPAVLADPNATLRSRITAKATSFRWQRGVTGVLLTPKIRAGALPVVVQYYHCAGFLKGGVGDEIPMLPLVEHGIAVLCMDRVRAPEGEGTDKSYALALGDIESALDGLETSDIIDGDHVGIGGLSFGSEVALWAVRHSNRFAAATIASGQMSPIYYWANALPERGFTAMLDRYWKIGDPDRDADRWSELTGLDDVRRIDTPILMQLPESEARFVIELHTKLKLAGKPAELFAFADEPHIKKQPAHKLAVYERNLDWYRFWLKGETDLDPTKSGQFARWRTLRAGQSLPAPAP